MNMRRFAMPMALMVAAVAATFASAAPAAQAHTASSFYDYGRWPLGATVEYGINFGFPGGAFRDRIYDAKEQWNSKAVTTNDPHFLWTLHDDWGYGEYNLPCNLSTGKNNTMVMFYRDLNLYGVNVAGVTLACRNQYTGWLKASITLDSTRVWYTGIGAGGGTDFWAASSHEWGHGTGFWEHWPETDDGVCPDNENSYRHVMCPNIYSGYQVQRYVKAHDEHTFQAAY